MSLRNHFFLLTCPILLQRCFAVQKSLAELLIVTVATDEHNDGLQRLRKSADTFGHKLQVFGTNERWNGGEMRTGTGGAQKVRILQGNLSAYRNRDDLIIMFVDAYDVILNADAVTILQRFTEKFNGQKILFGAEPFCWPDRTLAPKYPLISFGERFLNSGMFMGYAPEIVEMLELGVHLKDGDDDQLFYTKLFLDKEKRQLLGITLDSLSRIFQNLNGLTEHVQIDYDSVDGYAKVFNKLYNTHPVVIHGNGPSKLILNSIGNYIAHRVHNEHGCEYCGREDTVSTTVDSPLLVMGLFMTRPIPYVEEFLDYIRRLNYPKEKIHLFVFNNQEYNKKTVASFIADISNSYASVKGVNVDSDSELLTDEYAARNFMLTLAHDLNADYALLVDADSHLTDSDALINLLRVATAEEIGILTPMLVKPGLLFSNFWGALSESGFYARSPDYVPIVERQRVGTWNVPFINSVWLISRCKIEEFNFVPPFSYNRQLDVDMSFAAFCRDNGHFMFVDNQREYGYLVDADHFANLSDNYIHREIYDYPNNRVLWERRYIHADYFDLLKPDVQVPLACPDVYDFPFLSEQFCNEIIEVMEHYGKWSDGSNHDRRLEGGYENVPTRDIHMNQVGLEQQWLAVLDAYVAPIQEKIFIGYYQRPVKANMMFVVRYRPDEQPSLRPHHDASTYSIDVALNKRGVDYEGGGVRYVRYNCTVPADQIGWSMIFPGRLTHLHEGLPTTKGTRYILVSFINP